MGKLTDKRYEVLGALYWACKGKTDWSTRIAVMDLGGHNASYHSATLAALCKKGYAVRKKLPSHSGCYCKCGEEAQFGHRCKGSFMYWITPEGVFARAKHFLEHAS